MNLYLCRFFSSLLIVVNGFLVFGILNLSNPSKLLNLLSLVHLQYLLICKIFNCNVCWMSSSAIAFVLKYCGFMFSLFLLSFFISPYPLYFLYFNLDKDLSVLLILSKYTLFILFFYLFAISWATPTAYGGSRARGLIGAYPRATAASAIYTTTHSNARSLTH